MDCGIPATTPGCNTAPALSRPLKVVFKAIYKPQRQIETESDASSYYPTAIFYRSSIGHVFEQHIYHQGNGHFAEDGERARVIQAGNINSVPGIIYS
jgi:hydrogenase-4 component B